MMGFLIDTNCISELVRLQPEPRVVAWFEGQEEGLLYLSVLTLGEIRKGLESLPKTRKKKVLESWLLELKLRFAGRLLPVDAGVTERWGRLAAWAKRKGQVLSVIDGLLAATALQHDLTIVTRNVSNFSKAGIPLMDPWQSSAEAKS